MSSKGYQNYLNSTTWKKKKGSVKCFHFTGKRCYLCGTKKTEAHHKTYKRLGYEKPEDIVFLCRYHHKGVHEFCKENKINLYNGTQKYIELRKKIPKEFKWTRHMIHVYKLTGKIPSKLDFPNKPLTIY